MAQQVEIKGLDNVLKNLNKEAEKLKDKSRVGLIKAVLLVRREAQKITPVDTGNLINSTYTVVSGGDRNPTVTSGENQRFGGKDSRRLDNEHIQSINLAKTFGKKHEPIATIGFSAYYAAYVHEMTEAKFKKPNARAKFLETPLKENTSRILQIIKENARVR